MRFYPWNDSVNPMRGCLKHILSRLLTMPLITTLLRPGLRGLPVLPEFRIPPAAFAKSVSKTGNLRQRSQVMRVTLERFLLVWEFMPLRLLRNARLQGTLLGIPRQIVCAIPQPLPQQSFRFLQSNRRKLLQVFPIHEPSSYRRASRH